MVVVAKRADPKALASVGITKFAVGDNGCSGAVVSLASRGVVEVLAVDTVLALVALVRLGLALGFAAALAVLASGFVVTGVT